MKSLLLLPVIALSPRALANEVAVSAAGGVVIMDQLETLGDAWTVNGRVDYFFDDNVGIELETGVLGGKTRIGDYPYFGLTPRLNIIGRLWTEGQRGADGEIGDPPPVRPLLVAGLGGFYKHTDDTERDADGNPVLGLDGEPIHALGPTYKRRDIDFMLNAGPGLLIPLTDTIAFRTDVRWLVNLGSESFRQRGDRFIDWEWNAGISLHFGGPSDRDKDGVLDDDDLCPEQPEDEDGFEDGDGCPDPDNDGDGVEDTDDGCANDAEDLDSFEDEDGCPDPDNDGDTILDGDDECPTVAGHTTAAGCPDEDGDAIVDEEDECPDEAGPEASFGCPDEDGDRVPDYRDQCPDEPAPQGADPLRSDGCPRKVFITQDAIRILDKIFFDVGKSTIKRKSHALLDEIAATLEQNASIKKVQIEGHTDNTGDPEKNKALSQARADAVRDYLIAKGIAAERLVAKGFGQDRPLVDGDAANTTEGRAKNRRVEFNIVEQEEVKVELVREKLTFEEAAVEVAGEIEVVQAVLPGKLASVADATCEAVLTVDPEGKVTGVKVHGCVAMPRSVTRRTFSRWVFAPMKDKDGKPIAVTVGVSMVFEAGVAKPTVNAKSVAPVKE